MLSKYTIIYATILTIIKIYFLNVPFRHDTLKQDVR